ncbi:HNH endonuclease [Terribacillus sp. DMT04]|uniref:HNH endonuclease n=1 Tax=Terribacillus sp. DMT04 TaxID=2850441 RepID=UPI001C2C3E9C|nr:HNH endonuclease [Terribacillus sp. DMT04]QXE00909.1 HNH endonuclease [Terribacillus sp. DMT04]
MKTKLNKIFFSLLSLVLILGFVGPTYASANENNNVNDSNTSDNPSTTIIEDAPDSETEEVSEEDFQNGEILEDDNSSLEGLEDVPATDDSFSAQWAFLIPPAIAIVSRVGGKLVVKQYLKKSTKNITIRNGHLAGKTHSSGIKFDSKGFPKFPSKFNTTLPTSLIKSSNSSQFRAANAALKKQIGKDSVKKKFSMRQVNDIKNGLTPRGMTWHHHQNTGKLQLVDTAKHKATGHTGGKSIWGSL